MNDEIYLVIIQYHDDMEESTYVYPFSTREKAKEFAQKAIEDEKRMDKALFEDEDCVIDEDAESGYFYAYIEGCACENSWQCWITKRQIDYDPPRCTTGERGVTLKGDGYSRHFSTVDFDEKTGNIVVPSLLADGYFDVIFDDDNEQVAKKYHTISNDIKSCRCTLEYTG